MKNFWWYVLAVALGGIITTLVIGHWILATGLVLGIWLVVIGWSFLRFIRLLLKRIDFPAAEVIGWSLVTLLAILSWIFLTGFNPR
jgi:hypothetical protein